MESPVKKIFTCSGKSEEKRGDLIELDIEGRSLNVVGIAGKHCPAGEVEAVFAERRKTLVPWKPRYERGVLKTFTENAAPPMEGGYIG